MTITLDRQKANRARGLTACRSTSQVIDLALDRLIELAFDLHREKARTKYSIDLPVGAAGALES